MQNIFDVDYEQKRLDMLVEQCLVGNDTSGEVIFGALEEENRLDFSYWNFDHHSEKTINESGFKHYLTQLLDDLMIYRTNHNQDLSRCGVVIILHSKVSIKWVSDFEMNSLSELK